MKIEDSREILIKGFYDVIVIGGGIAGIAAAVAASRGGAKTLIIEKTVVFGGLATIGLVTWYEPICDCKGKKMISGIPEELLKLSIEYGFDDLDDSWKNGNTSEKEKNKLYATHYSASIFAMAIDKYLKENNVAIRLDSLATFPVMENNICKGVVCETKSGKEFFSANLIIDATGDADIMHKAGVPCIIGENYLTSLAHYFSYEDAKKYVQDRKPAHISKWLQLGSDLFGNGQDNNLLYDGTDSDQITEYMLKTREMIFNHIIDSDRNSRDISRIPMMPQFRTTRHIVGKTEFSTKDKGFSDTVGSFGDFRQKSPNKPAKHYHLPYSCMYNEEFPNMIAAGRILSTDRDGWEVTRVIPVAALSGEAAGTAAALAIKYNSHFSNLDINLLQSTLKNNGVLFED